MTLDSSSLPHAPHTRGSHPKSKSLSCSGAHIDIPPSLRYSPYLLSPGSPFRHYHTLAQLHDRDLRHDELCLLDTVPIGASSPYSSSSFMVLEPQRPPYTRCQSRSSDGGSDYWAALGHDLHDLRLKYDEEDRKSQERSENDYSGGRS